MEAFAKQYSDYLVNDQKYILTYFVSLEKYSEHCINLVKTYSESLGLRGLGCSIHQIL